MQTDAKYWFAAKRYGWGWGLPTAWQGWVVLAGFVALIAAGAILFPPRQVMAEYLIYVAAVSIGLVVVCWLKGEPPRWRWGKDES